MPTIATLKSALIRQGLATSGKKADLLSRLNNGFQSPMGTKFKQIMSLDLGYKNCAMAIIDRDNHILHWQLHSLTDKEDSENSLSVRQIAKATQSFYNLHLTPHLNSSTLVVIERQRYRSGGQKSVLEAALKNVLMESVLSVLIEEKQLVSVEPKAVAKYWGLPEGYAEKKKAAVRLVADRIKDLNSSNIEVFQSSKKKDDLADALLQAWAVREWLSEKR